MLSRVFLADTHRWNDVDSTLIQRQDVESTLSRRCVYVVCLLGFLIEYIYMGRANEKYAFEHAQNVLIHIILRMRKVSSGSLLSIDIFCSSQWFKQLLAKALIRLRGCICPKTRFCMARPIEFTYISFLWLAHRIGLQFWLRKRLIIYNIFSESLRGWNLEIKIQLKVI